uniref:Uncharacterized protein n=1 Tax=Cannabis sativa TaxID=3483 RepID=A0A803NHB2_CANSA
MAVERILQARSTTTVSPSTSDVEVVVVAPRKAFVVPSPVESGRKIKMYALAFYAACTVGGILSCGLTHMAITPLDLVKCNMQVRFSQNCCLNFI